MAAGRLAGTRGAILCFHGLDIKEPSTPSMHIPLERFEAIVTAVRGVGKLVTLQELITAHLAGRSTAGLIALTADDAYVSWLAAESFLARHSVPLTIFAVADALRTGATFWWDRIEESASRADPQRWRRFEDDCGLPDLYRQGHQPPHEGPVRPMRQWVLSAHAGRWPTHLETPLDHLELELGHRTSQRAMTDAELSGFLMGSGAQVGVHTVSHAALPFLTDDEVIAEVEQGYEALRTRFPGALPYLAIPFGLFDARTLRLAAQAGMTASLTLEGLLDPSFSAEIGIPRVCVVREHQPGKLSLKTSGVAWLLERFRRRANSPYPVLPSASM